MNPSPNPATVGLFRPPLTTPLLAESLRTDLGHALENYCAPLVAYCERQQENDDLTEAQFRHGQQICDALAALVRYDEHTDQLLRHYRAALTAGQELAAAQVPTLEAALQPDWQAIALRLLGRLHRYEPAPAPSPLVARVRALLDSPALQARAARPLDKRRALAGITAHDLDPHALTALSPPVHAQSR